MIKHFYTFLTIFLLFTTSTCTAKPIQAIDVQVYKKNNTKVHVASYLYDITVFTILDGPHKGVQEIFIKEEPMQTSRKAIFAENFFIHFYPDQFVYSTLETQCMQAHENSQGKICSASNEDIKKF